MGIKNKALILCMTTVAYAGLTGCQESIKKATMDIYGIDDYSSEYKSMSAYSTSENYDKYLLKISGVQKKEVEDKKRIYYFEFFSKDVFGSLEIDKEYLQVKNYLQTGRGFLEPVYLLDENLNLVIDREATAELHRSLSKELNLLPLSETYKADKKILAYVHKRSKESVENIVKISSKSIPKSGGLIGAANLIGGSMSAMSQVLDDFSEGKLNNIFYNDGYYQDVISEIGDFDFTIFANRALFSMVSGNYQFDSLKRFEVSHVTFEDMLKTERYKYMQSRGYSNKRLKTIYQKEKEDEIKRGLSSVISLYGSAIDAQRSGLSLEIFPNSMLESMKISGVIPDVPAGISIYNTDYIRGNIKENEELMGKTMGLNAITYAMSSKKAVNETSIATLNHQVSSKIDELNKVAQEVKEDRIEYIGYASMLLGNAKNEFRLSTGIKSKKLD
jgi:hypothetical protein